MGVLAKSLKRQGFERTERESPFDDNGTLWANSHELVCDETGIVVRSNEDLQRNENEVAELSAGTPRYSGSNKVILPGGFASAYDWGDNFSYER